MFYIPDFITQNEKKKLIQRSVVWSFYLHRILKFIIVHHHYIITVYFWILILSYGIYRRPSKSRDNRKTIFKTLWSFHSRHSSLMYTIKPIRQCTSSPENSTQIQACMETSNSESNLTSLISCIFFFFFFFFNAKNQNKPSIDSGDIFVKTN